MLLTFEQNKFVLKQRMYRDRILSIKEAVRFRSRADSKALNLLNRLLLKPLPFPTGAPLFPNDQSLKQFQLERGIPFILSGNRRYLAHQPGLGKSAQWICSTNTKPGQSIVVAPSFLKWTWVREITKWSYNPFPRIAIVPDSPRKDKMNWDADYVICSDSMIQKDWVRENILKTKFRHFGIDEGHRYKTFDAGRTVALYGGQHRLFKSPGLIYNSEHATVLSGTPMLSRPLELWTTLFAMAPETIDFMSQMEFGQYYCNGYIDANGWNFNGASNEAELKTRLYKTFMQRITKKEVLPELPDKIREVVLIDKDTREKDIVALDRDLTLKFKSKPDNVQHLKDYAIVRHQTGRAKIKWVIDFVKDILENDSSEAIILFGYHRDVVEKVFEGLKQFKPQFIIGGVSNDVRLKIEDAFQSGRIRLTGGNIDAMNLGLTLTKATRVIFMEYHTTPAANEQAEDRAHRIGQLDSVYVQYLALANSLDEHYLNLILSKQKTIERVIG